MTIQTVAIRSSQISILGQVGKPGRFPIEIVGSKVSEMIAAAGGVLPGGADVVTLVGNRNGKPVKLDIDLPPILQSGRADLDVVVENGDIIYVDRAPTFYMYGEVQRPGAAAPRTRHDAHAGARAGRRPDAHAAPSAASRSIARTQRAPSRSLEMKMNDPVERDDVIYVRESLF